MKQCNHNHEFDAASAQTSEGRPPGRTVHRRIEMTVEREVISVVRRAAGPGVEGASNAGAAGAVCELCGQVLPAAIPALPAETGDGTDSTANDEVKR
jgi:hypothetical protein